MSLVSLYDEASLWMTPSGAKDGRLFSELPVPVYGPELVRNGGFDSGTGWSTPSGWSISNGTLQGTNVAAVSATQAGITFLNKSFRVEYTITEISQGDVRIYLGGTQSTPNRNAVGTYVEYIDITTANTTLYIQGINNFTGKIDNILVKEVSNIGDFTFSRGSNLAATRVGPTGLIEKGRENLLLQSNQFDTTWVLTDSINLTSGQTGYDGSSDAWKLENTLSAKYLHQSIAVSGVQTISFYAKSGTLDWAFILINSSNVPRVYFDLQNGLVGSELGSVIDSKIESVDATGWYRISITFNETISQIRIYPAAADNDITGTGSIYIQDAQLEIGLAATDYIESGATTGKAGLLEDEPRLDYSGGATCPSLLLEPSRTNLVPFSEYWKGYFTIDTDVTISVNVATSPEGVQNAGRLKYDLASRSMYKSAMGLTGEHSVSFWVKGDGSNIGKTFNLRLQGTSIDQNIPITLTSDWVRVEAQTNGLNILELNNRNSTTIDTGSLLLYGFQIEQGSYPTSYIPNHSGGSVTRGADSCSITGASDVIGQTEGTLFGEFFVSDIVTAGSYVRTLLNDGSSVNQIAFFYYPDGRIQATSSVGGSLVVSINIPSYGLSLGKHKFAFSYKLNDYVLFIDGVNVGANTSASVPSMSVFNLYDTSGGSMIYKQALLFKERLSNAELAKLTTL